MLLTLILSLLFQPAANYTQQVTDACLNNFRCNKRPGGFDRFDYVSGLVAKATIEAVQVQSDSTYVQPWYDTIRAYGNRFYATGFSLQPNDLDILNACKLYFSLRDVAASGCFGPDSATVAHCDTALTRAARALAWYRQTYVISDSVSQAYSHSSFFTGGWWHKRQYQNEMWCDGQYMGPALMAELLRRGYTIPGLTTEEAWADLIHQIDITWLQLWDPEQQLLYHAFSASPELDPNWADQDTTSLHYGVSAEYWSRAIGWYFMALIDILESMQLAPQDQQTYLGPAYYRLQDYLQHLALGVSLRQDSASGCWAQLLAHPVGWQPEGCELANYLESSGSALFAACYLKGIRLGVLPESIFRPMAEKAFQGVVEQFLVEDVGDGNPLALIHSCASAGLSDTRHGDAAYYLIGKDVTRITTYTEGKVLGAFILASTEYWRLLNPSHP